MYYFKKSPVRILIATIVVLVAFGTCVGNKDASISDNILSASKQLKYALELVEPLRGDVNNCVSPRSLNKNGNINMVPSQDWTSGFFAGELWIMYDLTKDSYWKNKARIFTEALEKEKLNRNSKNIGVKMFCSYGLGYQLTQSISYRKILIETANSLVDNFNPKIGCIGTHVGDSLENIFQVNMGCMMDLELLFLASDETKDSIYAKIAIQHALTTIKNQIRADGSTYCLIDYNLNSGQVEKSWTMEDLKNKCPRVRNEALALYSYTTCYEKTNREEFLKQAEKIAKYLIEYSNGSTDLIPNSGISNSNTKETFKDITTASILASALYKLSLFSANTGSYTNYADRIIKLLTSKTYKSSIGENQGFLLHHSSKNISDMNMVNASEVYADYYFLEAICRKYSSCKKP